MPLRGTLRTWHDDRGYGFIAPTDGGREVFVHISAFPGDGGRPTQGEQLRYTLGRGKDGKVQAVQATRLAIGTPPSSRRDRTPSSGGGGVVWAGLAVLVVVIAAFVLVRRSSSPVRELVSSPNPRSEVTTPAPSFHCDGRRHCSQMTSCAEATYFLKNCPGVEMDGDQDGVPCERQWCTSPFSK